MLYFRNNSTGSSNSYYLMNFAFNYSLCHRGHSFAKNQTQFTECPNQCSIKIPTVITDTYVVTAHRKSSGSDRGKLMKGSLKRPMHSFNK